MSESLVLTATQYGKTIKIVYGSVIGDHITMENFLNNFTQETNNLTVLAEDPIDVIDVRNILKFFKSNRVENVTIQLNKEKKDTDLDNKGRLLLGYREDEDEDEYDDPNKKIKPQIVEGKRGQQPQQPQQSSQGLKSITKGLNSLFRRTQPNKVEPLAPSGYIPADMMFTNQDMKIPFTLKKEDNLNCNIDRNEYQYDPNNRSKVKLNCKNLSMPDAGIGQGYGAARTSTTPDVVKII